MTDVQQVHRLGFDNAGIVAFGSKASAGSPFFRDNSSRVFTVFGLVGFLMILIPALVILLEIMTPWRVTKLVENICGPICHHIPTRTITLRHPMPVCARCAGLYFGWLLASALLYRTPAMAFDLAEARTRRFLMGLSFVFAASVSEAGLEAIGCMTLPNWPRLLIGLPLGLFPAFVLLLSVKTLLAEARRCANRSSIRKGTS